MFDVSAEQLEETRASYEAHAQARADETLKRAENVAEAAKVACDSVKLLSDQPYEEIIGPHQIRAATSLRWHRTAGVGWRP